MPHTRETAPFARNGRRLRLFALVVCVTAAVVLIDQISKAIALDRLSEQMRIPLIGDLLGLQLAFNAGTVMSVGSGATGLLTMIAVIAMPIAFIAATKVRTRAWAIVVGLLWGGAMGNLIDRLFAPPGFGIGHVIDFVAYGDLFIGNLADVALGAGVVLGLILAWRARRPSQERADDAEAELREQNDHRE